VGRVSIRGRKKPTEGGKKGLCWEAPGGQKKGNWWPEAAGGGATNGPEPNGLSMWVAKKKCFNRDHKKPRHKCTNLRSPPPWLVTPWWVSAVPARAGNATPGQWLHNPESPYDIPKYKQKLGKESKPKLYRGGKREENALERGWCSENTRRATRRKRR